jgi:hypothetical protein
MTHPITVPPELVKQWFGDYYDCPVSGEISGVEAAIATRAAAWGSDQELEACCKWLDERFRRDPFFSKTLRAARRPKAPSLKEQALKELAWVGEHLDMPLHNHCNAIHTIQRALEQLDD